MNKRPGFDKKPGLSFLSSVTPAFDCCSKCHDDGAITMLCNIIGEGSQARCDDQDRLTSRRMSLIKMRQGLEASVCFKAEKGLPEIKL